MQNFDLLVEKVLNGLSKNKSLKQIAKKHKVSIKVIEKQLAMGVKVEKEHTDSKKVASKIATDHLVEDPHYYTKLKKMEK